MQQTRTNSTSSVISQIGNDSYNVLRSSCHYLRHPIKLMKQKEEPTRTTTLVSVKERIAQYEQAESIKETELISRFKTVEQRGILSSIPSPKSICSFKGLQSLDSSKSDELSLPTSPRTPTSLYQSLGSLEPSDTSVSTGSTVPAPSSEVMRSTGAMASSVASLTLSSPEYVKPTMISTESSLSAPSLDNTFSSKSSVTKLGMGPIPPRPPPPSFALVNSSPVKWPKYHVQRTSGTIHQAHNLVYFERDAAEMADFFRNTSSYGKLKRSRAFRRKPAVARKEIDRLDLMIHSIRNDNELFPPGSDKSTNAVYQKIRDVLARNEPVDLVIGFVSLFNCKKLCPVYKEKLEKGVFNPKTDADFFADRISREKSFKHLASLYELSENVGNILTEVEKRIHQIFGGMKKLQEDIVGELLNAARHRGNLANGKKNQVPSFPLAYLEQLLAIQSRKDRSVKISHFVAKDLMDQKSQLQSLLKDLEVLEKGMSMEELKDAIGKQTVNVDVMKTELENLQRELKKERRKEGSKLYRVLLETKAKQLQKMKCLMAEWIKAEKYVAIYFCAEGMDIFKIIDKLKNASKLILEQM